MLTITTHYTHISKTTMDQIGQAGQMTRMQMEEPILSEWAKRLTTKEKLEGTPHVIGHMVEKTDGTGSTFHVQRIQCECTECQHQAPLSEKSKQSIIDLIDGQIKP